MEVAEDALRTAQLKIHEREHDLEDERRSRKELREKVLETDQKNKKGSQNYSDSKRSSGKRLMYVHVG